ncbi:MAG: putative oxidoreductase protein [Acidimicrobiales bacterium]|nr:putative oxidoreductase protein [Acidimicrobiales bacterium]
MSAPIAVGLVGAGPWATMVHAPLLAGGAETRLAGVWARRPEAATELADHHHTEAVATFEDLLDRCDAVAFAVPPAVQAELAPLAARAGKGLLLEKPIADTLEGARRLAEAVTEAGVGSLVMFTARYTAQARAFLAQAEDFEAFGALHVNIGGGFLEGPYSQSPWRHERGILLDVGPHAVDLLDAALGPVVDVDARASGGLVQLTLGHQGGILSTSILTGLVPGGRQRTVDLYGPAGTLRLDLMEQDDHLFATIRSEFAEVVRTGGPHPCDVHRGLEVQEIVAAAEARLAV